MANVINYAERWEKELLEIVDDGTYSSPFIVPSEAVKFVGAKTVHFTAMQTSGYKTHSRDGGWNKGSVVQSDVPLVIQHDRDIELLLDKADVDESNQVASIENVSKAFIRENYAPEVDARFFEKVAEAAIKDGFYQTQTGWTAGNTYGRLVKLFQSKNLKPYRAMGGLIAFVRGDIMDCLENSTEVQKTLDIKVQAINEKNGISTRVAFINGVSIIEVVDDARFWTKFDYSDGFAGEGSQLNVVIAHPLNVKTVPKISSIYTFAPGEHTEGDGYLYQNRGLWDTFVFPNGKDGKCDAVYVSIASTEPSVMNYPDKTLEYDVGGTAYPIKADGTKVVIEADESAAVDYLVTLTGKAPKTAATSATAIWGTADVKNNAVFLVELASDELYYGRGASKVTSGMALIGDSDKVTIGDTTYLLIAKGLDASGNIIGGDYFSVGTGAAAATKSFKIIHDELKQA